MENYLEKMWKFERDKKDGIRFDWWFWVFFIKSRKGKPRQIMLTAFTKNCKKLKVNDNLWERKDLYSESKFSGIFGSWYFDGSRSVVSPLIEKTIFHIKPGELTDENGNFLFRGGKKFSVEANIGNEKISVKAWQGNKSSGHRHISNSFLDKSVSETTLFQSLEFSGKISSKGKTEKISGTAYLQKVRTNAPISPWYWGVSYFDDGSFAEYFVPYIGSACLRRNSKEEKFFDKIKIPIFCWAEFYNAAGKKSYIFNKASVKREIVNGLPVFSVSAKDGEKNMKMKVKACGSVQWRVFQPLAGGLGTKLFYNEYPTILEDFEFSDGKKIIRKKDLGNAVGNSEHTWGMLF